MRHPRRERDRPQPPCAHRGPVYREADDRSAGSLLTLILGRVGRGELKWFRIENVSDAKLDPREPFRDADSKTVDAHLRASLDGFHEGGTPTRQVFFVSDPDAAWVARNLMDAMECEEEPDGIRGAQPRARARGRCAGAGGAGEPPERCTHYRYALISIRSPCAPQKRRTTPSRRAPSCGGAPFLRRARRYQSVPAPARTATPSATSAVTKSRRTSAPCDGVQLTSQ